MQEDSGLPHDRPTLDPSSKRWRILVGGYPLVPRFAAHWVLLPRPFHLCNIDECEFGAGRTNFYAPVVCAARVCLLARGGRASREFIKPPGFSAHRQKKPAGGFFVL